ncbi:MAG: hypothetical protein KA188_09305 [Leadbetterella sp.]|nr:hypothetical protein [Leadbetterella sp.]
MDIQKFYPNLSEKRILRSHTGVEARIYNSWKQEGILWEEIKFRQDSEKREWEYLNVFEALWLLVIVELRKLNLNLEAIKSVRDFLQQTVNPRLEIEKLSEEEFQKKVVQEFHPGILEQHGGTITKEAFLELLPKTIEIDNSFIITNIGVMLYGVLIEKTSPSLIIELNNEKNNYDMAIAMNSHPNTKFKKDLYEFYTKKFSESMFVNLPILPIVEKLFEREDFEKHKLNYGLYTKQENQLLESIRENECTEVKIIKHKSGDITMNFSEQDDITGLKAKELRKLLGLKRYEKVEVTFRNENHMVIKNTQKQIIKK